MLVEEYPMPVTLSHSRRVERKVSVGDRAEIEQGPGLLKFLMTEATPGGARPGRRMHPMSGIPLGIGIEAAIIAASGKESGIDVLRACECDYLHPIGADDNIRAIGEVLELGRHHLKVLMEVYRADDRKLLMRGTAILVHSVDGKASDISAHHGLSE